MAQRAHETSGLADYAREASAAGKQRDRKHRNKKIPKIESDARFNNGPRLVLEHHWYCDQCHVEVYGESCRHCGKHEADDA